MQYHQRPMHPYHQTKKFLYTEKYCSRKDREWVGLFSISTWDPAQKRVYIRNGKVGPTRPFNFPQVEKYLEPKLAYKYAWNSRRTPPKSHANTNQNTFEDVMLTEVFDLLGN